MGLFVNSGLVLGIGGPSGAMLSYGLVAVGVVCVMEGISEMIGHWPVQNAMIEFVSSFVDEEMATVVGLGYWVSYSISFSILIITAADLASYWDSAEFWNKGIFIFLLPATLLFFNCLGVKWYGNVESIAGVLKIFLVLFSFVLMLVINAGVNGKEKIGAKNLRDQFQHREHIASNNAVAVLVGIPIATYAYAGVEIVAVTAVEARNPRESLRFSAQWIAYITSGIYILSILAFNLNVSWNDWQLPQLSDYPRNTTSILKENPDGKVNSTAVAIIAAEDAGFDRLTSFLNVCLILAILSTANTALYVASRTLFGISRQFNSQRWYHKLGTTYPKTKVPLWSLLASAAAFYWIPFMRLGGVDNAKLKEIFSGASTVTTVIVWASQCLAFLRYRHWLKKHRKMLVGETFKKFNRWATDNPSAPFSSHLAYIQPWPAAFGLVACLLTILVFSSANWWAGIHPGADVAATWFSPILCIALWVGLKIYNRKLRWGSLVRPLSDDWGVLKHELLRLNDLIYIEADNEPPSIITEWVAKSYRRVFRNKKENSEPRSSQKAPGSESGLGGVGEVVELSMMTPAK